MYILITSISRNRKNPAIFEKLRNQSLTLVFVSTVCNCGGGPCDSVTGECLEEGFETPTGMDCPIISKNNHT